MFATAVTDAGVSDGLFSAMEDVSSHKTKDDYVKDNSIASLFSIIEFTTITLFPLYFSFSRYQQLSMKEMPFLTLDCVTEYSTKMICSRFTAEKKEAAGPSGYGAGLEI